MTNEQLDTFMRYAKYSESVIWFYDLEVVELCVKLRLLQRFEKKSDRRNPYGYVRPTVAGKDLYNTQKSLLTLTDNVLQGL